jgi:hypothetical protein
MLRAANVTYSDAQLETLSGIPARAIKSYRVEGREPSLHAALSLAVVIGSPAVNAILALIGYSAHPLDEAGDCDPRQIVADGLRHFTVIAEAAADGRIDHTERPACQQAADKLIEAVMPLSSVGDAA